MSKSTNDLEKHAREPHRETAIPNKRLNTRIRPMDPAGADPND